VVLAFARLITVPKICLVTVTTFNAVKYGHAKARPGARPEHAKADQVLRLSLPCQFCQQCARLHPLRSGRVFRLSLFICLTFRP
jgi:hypothetical protein